MTTLTECMKDIKNYIENNSFGHTLENGALDSLMYGKYAHKYNLALINQAIAKMKNVNYRLENQYIIDAICDEEKRNFSTSPTDRQKLQFLADKFKSDYAHNIKAYKTEIFTLENWLRGLPSYINIEFMNYNIGNLLIVWGVMPENASDDEWRKKVDNYWQFMAMRILSLWNKHEINFRELS